MDQTTLLEGQIHEGDRLLSHLDACDLQIRAAFWLYDSEIGSWRLYLASTSPQLDVVQNPLAAYGKLVAAVQSLQKPLKEFASSALVVVPMNHPYVKNIAAVVQIGREATIGVRFSNIACEDLIFDGLYVYRMDL